MTPILASALFVLGVFCLLLPVVALAQSTAATSATSGFDNPVIPGMAPDPSVCRVGDDYYLVTSTFEYFPGVPVYHSKDLIHWRLLGYSLSRPSQLPLVRLTRNGGIWAATIRYHDGTFYVVTTNKSEGHGNFFVRTKDPAGDWSEPIPLDQGGIDPSLFFDDDGKAYLTTAGSPDCGARICQSEIDIKTGQRLSDIKPLWSGTGGSSPEGPHLYKINGYYYLMIAEGGTEYGHGETIARSRSPWGPFEANPRNPILTHRNFKASPIQGTGHVDLIQAHDGSWWAVFLGFRPATRMAHHLGRETFLAPVTWPDDGWPIINGNGTITPHMDVQTLSQHPQPEAQMHDEFSQPKLALPWNVVRNLERTRWSLAERPGWLRLKGSSVTLDDTDAAPVFVGRRQQHFESETTTQVDFQPGRQGEEAGLALRMNDRHHYEFGIKRGDAGGREVYLRYAIGSIRTVAATKSIGAGLVRLRIRSYPELYRFSYAVGNEPFQDFGGVETRYLSSEVADGFNGVFVGLFATGRGRDASVPADFDWFDYRAVTQPRLSQEPRLDAPLSQESPTNAQPAKNEAVAAMKKAATFMVEKVAYRGGYVWAVSEDFRQRYGEVPARRTQIWVQDGTPLVGMTLLDAYDLTGDRFYLEAARKAADALISGQHRLGGWHYFIDFDPKGIEEWYAKESSRFKWGMEEYRHYYGNATFDDSNTASATRFLLRFYLTTRAPSYRKLLTKALNFILIAQYKNGAWPQRYPLRHEFTHDGFADYTSYYTLNDGSAKSNIEVLVEAYEKLGDKRYLAAAKRGVEFMIRIQGPVDQAGWAEQYDPKTMRPVKARTHEPAGFVIRESIQVIEILEMFYQMTGDPRYLKPIPRCLAWFDRINREASELKRPPARYYEPGTNLPIYNLKTDKTNAEGYGLYRWSNTDAQGDGEGLYRFGAGPPQIRPVVNVEPLRKEYERVAAQSETLARVEYQKRHSGWDSPREDSPRPGSNASVAEIISAMDNRGAWLRNDVRVLTVIPQSQGINPGTFEMIRGYSTQTFVRNMRALMDYSKVAK